MRCLIARTVLFAVVGLVSGDLVGAWLAVGHAQGAIAPPSAAVPAPSVRPVDPKLADAQRAFESLPEAERIAIQNDLVWVTPFSGAALGSFGRLTYEAISGFQKLSDAPVDGILKDKERVRLADGSKRARAQQGFAVQTDPLTGSGIGIASKILTRQEKQAVGTKWSSEAGDVTLETVRTSPDKADLAATFERFANPAIPGRKVTYKLLRPDFFVVTGDIGAKKFYTRFAPTKDGLRGYTLTYDASLAQNFERVVIATANSFEPLRNATPQAVQPQPAPPAVNARLSTAPQTTSPVALTPVQTPPTERGLTALDLGGGKLLTAARALERCTRLSVAGKTAQLVASDAPSGLAIVATEGLAAAGNIDLRATPVKGGEALVAFGFDASLPQRKLSVAPGEAIVAAADGRPTLPVALQAGAGGSLVLDRSGQLAGLVIDLPPINRQIAGIIPVMPYHLASPDAIRTFVALHDVRLETKSATAQMTTGELYGLAGRSAIAISCGL